MRFTTLTAADLDEELHQEGIDRIESIEGLYNGILEIHASRCDGEWDVMAEWNDGHTNGLYLLAPIPGPH